MKTTKKNIITIIKENYMNEHHLHNREDKIDFILKNQYLTELPFSSPEELESMSDEHIESLYVRVEDEKDLGFNMDGDFVADADFDDMEIEEPVHEDTLPEEDKEINKLFYGE